MKHVGVAQIADPALRTNAKLVGLKTGVPFPDLGTIDGLTWAELHERKKEMMRFARALTDKLEAEKRAPDDAEERAIQYAIDWGAYINLELDHRSESGKLGPRPGRLRGDKTPSGEWRRADGTPVPVLTREERVADYVGAGGYSQDDEGLGFGQLVRAMLVGGKTDAERRALSEGTNADGGFTVNAILSAQVIDRMRAKSRVVQAGALTIPLDTLETKVARVSADPVVSWKSENAAASDVQPTLEQITFTARTLICLVRASRELIEDAANINEALAMVFAGAMAGELDRVCLYGSGVAPEPKGLAYTTGVNEVQVLTSLSNFDPLIDGVEKILTANAATPTAGILHPKTAAALAKLKDLQNNYLAKPEMLSRLPLLDTTQVPLDEGGSPAGTSVWLADWSELIIGVRAALRVEVLRERYADSYQLGFLAHLRADVQLLHAASFCRIRDISV